MSKDKLKKIDTLTKSQTKLTERMNQGLYGSSFDLAGDKGYKSALKQNQIASDQTQQYMKQAQQATQGLPTYQQYAQGLMNPQAGSQMAGLNQYSQGLMNPQAGSQLAGLQQYSQDLMNPSGASYQAFAAPMMKQYQQEIVPGMAERFSGLGAQSSSAFNQSMAQGGTDLAERLATLKANLGMQGAQLGQQNIGLGMQGAQLGQQNVGLGLQGGQFGLQGMQMGLQGAELGMKGSGQMNQMAQSRFGMAAAPYEYNMQRASQLLGTPQFAYYQKPQKGQSATAGFFGGMSGGIGRGIGTGIGAAIGGAFGGPPGAVAGATIGSGIFGQQNNL